jgi:hypothetical protein
VAVLGGGAILALALIAQASPIVTPLESAEPAACDAPGQAPDPRCNDNLDGREAPEASAARRAARAALTPPRAAARLVLLPVVETTEAAERHHVFPWLRAITTSDDGKIGVRPEIQYATGFVPSVGFLFFDRRLPVPGSEVTARFKAGSPDIVRSELALRGPRSLGLILGLLWDRRDDRLFAGIGNPAPGAPAPVESRYSGDIYRAEALWYTPGSGPLTLTLRAGVEAREYDSSGVRGGPSIAQVYSAPPAECAARGLPSPCTDPAQVPGFDVDRRLLYQRARLALDLRRPVRDASGVELGVDGGVFHGVIADPSRYARLSFDGLAQIGGIDRALLLRFVAAVVEPLGATPVPFDEMISPCGSSGIRGLLDGLLRDRSGLVGTAEYRWLISAQIDASLFVDEGAVAGPWFAGLEGENFHTSVGAGLRFFPRDEPRYWEQVVSHQGIQVAYAPGRSIRLLLTAALF